MQMFGLFFMGNGARRAPFFRSFKNKEIYFFLWQPNSSNDDLQAITSGDWDVTKILAYDEKRQKM